MKGITKRTDGRFMVRHQQNGQRATKYAKTYNLALKTLTKLKKTKITINENNILFKNWAIEWQEKYKKPFVSQATFRIIRITVNKLIIYFKEIKLKDITTTKIQDYLNTIKKGKTKDNTILYFNAMLKKAVDINLINKNPMNAVVREKKTKYKLNAFNYEEQFKIMNELENSKIKQEILCYLMTGARPNELPQKENFNFNNKTVKIIGTKTEKAKLRIIELSEEYNQQIKNYLTNNNFLTVKEITKKFKILCNKINIDCAKIYRLRHTFATNHFVLGTNAKIVQDWLGHTDIGITLNIYTNIDKTLTKDKIKMLYKNLYYTV